MSDPTIAMATVCCIYVYMQLVIESDGDSVLEREREEGELEWGEMVENMKPRQIPQRTIYSYGWIHCHSQIWTLDVCVLKSLECWVIPEST